MTLPDFLLARIAEDEEHWRTATTGITNYVPMLLADCEAKRRIVEFFDNDLGDDRWYYEDHVLKPLAAVYADHPDYRDEWRP